MDHFDCAGHHRACDSRLADAGRAPLDRLSAASGVASGGGLLTYRPAGGRRPRSGVALLIWAVVIAVQRLRARASCVKSGHPEVGPP